MIWIVVLVAVCAMAPRANDYLRRVIAEAGTATGNTKKGGGNKPGRNRNIQALKKVTERF